MLIVVSPSLERMIIEMAVGEDAYPVLRNASANAARRICYPPPFTTADRAAELLAATSALQYLRSTRAAGAAPSAAAFAAGSIARGGDRLVAESRRGLGLGERRIDTAAGTKRASAPASDRLASAAVVWALASAEPLGLLTDAKVLDQAVGFLSGEFAKLSGNDHETRVALLHALSSAAGQHSSRPIV